MTIYISGKITGDPEYYRKFARAERHVRGMFPNAAVLSPTRHPEGLTCEQYMLRAYQDIADADIVLFLPDWENSEGAKLEYAHCRYTGKKYGFFKETQRLSVFMA